MSGTDIFIAILSGVMLFGGMYLNILSRRLSSQYSESHRPEISTSNSPVSKNTKK